jgi:hypothetical protein
MPKWIETLKPREIDRARESQPQLPMRRLLDGWKYSIELQAMIELVYELMRFLKDRGFAFPHPTAVAIPQSGDHNAPLTLRKVPEPRWKALTPRFCRTEEIEPAKHFVKDRRVDPEIELIRR